MNEKIYQYRKDNNLCVVCGKSDERTICGLTKCGKCAEKAKLCNSKNYVSPVSDEDKPTICWGCANAVPKIDEQTGKYIRGCEWSIRRKPVPGWETYCFVDYTYKDGKTLRAYSVKSCPKFKEG